MWYSAQYELWERWGGFISQRHNDLQDLTANMMSEVRKDTETEPKIAPF